MGPKGHTKKEAAMYRKKYGKKMTGHKKKMGKKKMKSGMSYRGK